MRTLNMSKVEIKIEDIFEGLMPSSMFEQKKGQYQLAIGIDPDMPLTDNSTDVKTGGAVRPVNYTAFSDSVVTSYPIAIITNPKDTYIYVVLANGRLVRYTSAFASETLIGTVSEGVANGAWYYNNYIYITGTTNVSRYGPLNGTPALVDGVWTGSTLGTLTALTNTTYPTSLLSTSYLNHYGISHVDGQSYFLDYKDGVGMVHCINTKKTTHEGDTNDGSAYNILDLPKNYKPFSICSYGDDMVVSASMASSSSLRQGGAALFFFNPADTTPSFYRKVTLPDMICSALIYTNGQLYGMSGDLNGGYKLIHYIGGESVETLKIIEEGNPPLQGAVSAVGNRIVWPADTTTPITATGLYGYGSKSDLFPRGLHHIAVATF